MNDEVIFSQMTECNIFNRAAEFLDKIFLSITRKALVARQILVFFKFISLNMYYCLHLLVLQYFHITMLFFYEFTHAYT